MSLKATVIAYKASGIDATAKLVLIELADFADDAGVSVVDHDALAVFAMCDYPNVVGALCNLADEGFIETHRSDDDVLIAVIKGAAT